MLTLKRNTIAQDTLRAQAEEISQWIKSTLGEEAGELPNQVQSDGDLDKFFNAIQNGVLLCKIMEKCTNQSLKYNVSAQNGSFQARDNVSIFVETCRKLEIPHVSLFVSEDLTSRKNDKQVINCLLHVARMGAKNGVSPPTIIQYELEIDPEEADNKNNEADEGLEEDFSPESYNITEPELHAIQGVMEYIKKGKQSTVSQEELVHSLLVDNTVKELAEKRPEFGNAIKALKSEEDCKTDLGEFLATLKNKQDAIKKKKAVSKKNYLPYVPKKGDNIDEALAEVVNALQVNIRIHKIRAKKGHKIRGSKVHGAYNVGKGKGKVHFRLIRGVLMARVGTEWEDIEQFLQRKAAEVDS